MEKQSYEIRAIDQLTESAENILKVDWRLGLVEGYEASGNDLGLYHQHISIRDLRGYIDFLC